MIHNIPIYSYRFCTFFFCVYTGVYNTKIWYKYTYLASAGVVAVNNYVSRSQSASDSFAIKYRVHNLC